MVTITALVLGVTMNSIRIRLLGTAALFAAGALAPLAAAQAGTCSTANVGSLTVGTAVAVAPGGARSFAVELTKGDGLIVDLDGYNDPNEASAADAAAGAAAAAAADAVAPPPMISTVPHRASGDFGPASHFAEDDAEKLRICDAAGAVLAPRAWDVFGGANGPLAVTDGGNRLRFVAPANGRYIIGVPAGDEARELLARSRRISASNVDPITVNLGSEQKGTVGKTTNPVYSFTASAGQWVELKAVSESDTVLRLAGPDRDGAYSEVAMNDDTDGLNPVIRRRLATAGTYYLRVETLGDSDDTFELSVKESQPPAPPPPPRPLALGRSVSDRLANEDDNRIYSLAVQAGRSYSLTLDAPSYDGYLAIGLANPVEPEEGSESTSAGFTEIRAQDSGLEGEEKMVFTARSTGPLLVLIRSFGIGETDGSYTLIAEDQGR